MAERYDFHADPDNKSIPERAYNKVVKSLGYGYIFLKVCSRLTWQEYRVIYLSNFGEAYECSYSFEAGMFNPMEVTECSEGEILSQMMMRQLKDEFKHTPTVWETFKVIDTIKNRINDL